MNPVLRIAPLAIALVSAVCATAPRAQAAPVVGAQARYWSFTNHNDMRDGLVYWAPGPFHVQLEEWDFVRGQDQFRPEIGLHYKDRRRSVTTLQWRHELGDERYWIGTEQVVSAHWVARAEASPIVRTHGSTLLVLDAGADVYWGSYSFAGATVIRDPRADGLWVVPVRARCANERNDWLQATLAPASRHTLGWALDAKLHVFRAGVERNSRFDFTNLDNTIVTLGVEFPLHAAR